MWKILILSCCLAGATSLASAVDTIPLYRGNIPNSIPGPDREHPFLPGGSDDFRMQVSRPTLSIFLPPADHANGTAVVILPGGGYVGVSMTNEGHNIAHAFNAMGIAAFVLKYRLPDDATMPDKTSGPLQDVQQAFRLVRSRAEEWRINPDRVGIVGFSAGGHLATTAATRFDRPALPGMEGINLRPDFVVLGYPVISFRQGLVHEGSRDALLGPAPSPTQVAAYSNELQVGETTPPTFLFHAGDDQVVPVENSLRYYEALHRHGVPAEMLLYTNGGHGFGIHNPARIDRWIDRCREWLISQGWL